MPQEHWLTPTMYKRVTRVIHISSKQGQALLPTRRRIGSFNTGNCDFIKNCEPTPTCLIELICDVFFLTMLCGGIKLIFNETCIRVIVSVTHQCPQTNYEWCLKFECFFRKSKAKLLNRSKVLRASTSTFFGVSIGCHKMKVPIC